MINPGPLDSRWRMLLIPGAVAIALHALVLSCHHLRKATPVSNPSPQAEDNTAELLQFASASDGPVNLKSNAPPANPVLPPPARFSSASPRRRHEVDRAAVPAPGRHPSKQAWLDSEAEKGAVAKR